MCTSTLSASFLLVLILGSPLATADTIYVDDSNPNCPGSGTEADPYCTISMASDASNPGDVIRIAAGSYVTSPHFSSH